MRTFYCEIYTWATVVVIAKNEKEAYKLMRENSEYSSKIELENIRELSPGSVYQFESESE